MGNSVERDQVFPSFGLLDCAHHTWRALVCPALWLETFLRRRITKVHWVLLAVGVGIEMLASAWLKLSDGFTKIGYAGLTLFCFGAAFYIMSLVVRTMPPGIAYSV